MKIDAISTHERALIIHQLEERGKWHGERMGAQVWIARVKTAHGGEIHYTVTIGRTVVNAKCKTVGEAVAEVNSVIHGRPAVAMAGRAPDPQCTGTPQLVRQRNGRSLDTEWLPYKDA